MGLKGYRLWVMGQLDSNVQSPTAKRLAEVQRPQPGVRWRRFSLHVIFAVKARFTRMTASMVHVTNLTPPGSGSTLHQNPRDNTPPGMVHVTKHNLTPPGRANPGTAYATNLTPPGSERNP
jgi:hypothetical protein